MRVSTGYHRTSGLRDPSGSQFCLYLEGFVKQLTAPSRDPDSPTSTAPTASLPLVTRFRDPSLPYEDLIICERDCMRCSYAMTLDCDGNCGSCPRQTYCPCVNPAKVRSKSVRLGEVELPMVASVGRN
jgi:hypothetical protein